MQGIAATLVRLSVSIALLGLAAIFGQFNGLSRQVARADEIAAAAAANDAAAQAGPAATCSPDGWEVSGYPLPRGSRPRDLAVAVDGSVWYTAQGRAALGRLDPSSGAAIEIPLGPRARPSGLAIAADGGIWAGDAGQGTIVRVDPVTGAIRQHLLPPGSSEAELAGLAFAPGGQLWFAGQDGIYGRLDPAGRGLTIFPAPLGRGPYGIAATANGLVYFTSAAGSYLAQVDPASGQATLLLPPTPDQGARRLRADARGRLWIAETIAGQIAAYDAQTQTWHEWALPEAGAQPGGVYVDWQERVWVSDLAMGGLLCFDPHTELFQAFGLPGADAGTAWSDIAGRPGEVWAASPAADRLVALRRIP